ncbi:hypothetical protein SUDANB145_03618 [Streptomyces sp. enrichment culture]|uniref:hypothetical protein n=1 Tax=Streptomyces sp. enrichment culture TaxID=1795815 RepID=UPI003F575C26
MGALLAGLLAPVTEHLGASLLDWSGQPWVAWPLFGLLCVLGGVLGTFVPLAPLERGGTGPDASPALTDPPTAPVTAGTATSLRPPRIDRHLRGREAERERLSALLRDPRGRFAVVCGAGGVGKTALAASVAARQGLAVCRAERAAQGQDPPAPPRGTGRRGRAGTRR